MTINEIFHETVAKHGAKVALRHKKDKAFEDITYAELARKVESFASALVALGIEKGDRVGLLSENRPEWVITDLAVLSLGAIVVPLYPTLPAPQVAYIVQNSGAKALIVENSKQLKKALDSRESLPNLKSLIVVDPGTETADGVESFADLTARGERDPLTSAAYAAHWESVQGDDVASFVYTSGTTGDPKGAMLTHNNFVWDVDAALAHYAGGGEPVTADDTFLSFLPLSHAYERTTGYYLPIRVGATIGYSEGVRTLKDDMEQVRPTLMVCVPRVYEALQERILDRAAKEPDAKRRQLFHEAIEVAGEVAERKKEGKSAGPILGAKHLFFDKLVLSKVRDGFGGKFRFLVSGGAALSGDTSRFFQAIGIPISEGYGMTESSPVMTINEVHRPKLGTVGTKVPGSDLKIAGDGEILYRGPNVMKGYWQNDAATRDVIDSDGWLHTGDIGVIDLDGYLKITDRKKDIIVLANGKNVAPQPIEQLVKESPFISEIVLIGDKQNIITALVLPNKTKLAEWAKEQGIDATDEDALLGTPEARKKIKQEIDSRSTGLADFEKIKKFTLLNAVFSVDSGEMTPTLKIKRKVVAQKYAKEIADMRGGADAAEG